MKFEVRPLSACTRLVNATVAIGLIFAVSACSGSDTQPEAAVEEPADLATDFVELPAVWSTSALDKPVADIALAGGLKPILAIAYEGRGFQLFDLDAERLAEPAPYAVTKLAAGFTARINDAELTVFPGINREGELNGYVFGEGLVAPVELSFNIGEENRVAGLCSAPAGAESDGLFRLGYWTTASDKFIHTGRIVEVNGEFAWLPDGPASPVASQLEACSLSENGVTASNGNIVDSALLSRGEFEALLTLTESGAISALPSSGGMQRLLIKNGISVVMPEDPSAIAALGTALGGGYGGGLIIAAGEVDGETRAVFIAADKLTGVSTSDQ